MNPNIYFSIDIETNGLCAGINSMLSLGVAAIDLTSGEIKGVFKRNLHPLEDLRVDEDTMNWWKKFPDAYQAATEHPLDAWDAIADFRSFVDSFAISHPVAAAWKPGFDIAFVRYYLFRFLSHDLFGRGGSGLDIKTLACIALNVPFSQLKIGDVPSSLKGSEKVHSHDSLADAIEQAYVLYNARRILGVNL